MGSPESLAITVCQIASLLIVGIAACCGGTGASHYTAAVSKVC